MTNAIPEALEAASRAYCLHQYNYTRGAYVSEEARERQIANDTASTAEEDWLRIVLAAAAPHLIAEGRRQAIAALRDVDEETAYWDSFDEAADYLEQWAANRTAA